MKKVSTFLTRRTSSQSNAQEPPEPGTPEAQIARGVRLFCESGGPNNAGEEVLHLPGIVEQAESSPAAAKEGAYIIRKFLQKDNGSRPYVQYNAVMLIRILTDHPGKTFTRNMDGKFVVTVKELLREGKDMSVQQILRETLDNFQYSKSDDETLKPLISMWSEYKGKMAKKGNYNPGLGAVQPGSAAPGPLFYAPPQSHRHHSGHRTKALPPPHELASRIEEAKTSAKLLTQMVQSTPSHEILGNELLKEFADRCQSASRSIQAYISAEDPAPDADTSLTLIETNDQLSMALSKHQRAVLQARKAMGLSPSPGQNGASSEGEQQRGVSPPAGATLGRAGTGQSTRDSPPRLNIPVHQGAVEDPFDDRHRAPSQERRTASQERGAETAPNNNGLSHAAAPREQDDDEESPEVERRYRF